MSPGPVLAPTAADLVDWDAAARLAALIRSVAAGTETDPGPETRPEADSTGESAEQEAE